MNIRNLSSFGVPNLSNLCSELNVLLVILVDWVQYGLKVSIIFNTNIFTSKLSEHILASRICWPFLKSSVE